MKLNRMLSLLLVVFLMTTLFSGCTKKDDRNNKKTLKISVWETQGSDFVTPKQPKENIVEKWLVDKTGVKIDSAIGNGGSTWESKLNLLIAGNNLPNIVHCGGGQGPAHFALLNESDNIWELTPEMLKEYAPNVWAKVPQISWEKIKVDGKIFGIPAQFPDRAYIHHESIRKSVDEKTLNQILNTISPVSTVTASETDFLVIRDDILKKLFPSAMSYDEAEKLSQEKKAHIGDLLVDIPVKTTDDFIKMMYDIKALNLTEDGNPVYAAGFDGGDLWYGLKILGAEMMGYKQQNYISAWSTQKNKMIMPLIEPITKEALRIENKMVLDSVIEKESLVHTSAQYKEKALSGRYALLQATGLGGLKELNKSLEKADKKYKYRPFYSMLENKEEYKASAPLNDQITWYESIGILKSVKKEDLPQILKWVDTMFSDEFAEIYYWGPKEAGLYVDNSDGTRTFKDQRFNDFFIDNKLDALQKEDTMGLSGKTYRSPLGEYYAVVATGINKWTHSIKNNKVNYSLVDNGYKFPIESKYVTDVKLLPSYYGWDPMFAEIPEVKELWKTRAQWEDPFKITLTAKNADDFEQKWQNAKANLEKIIDVPKMLDSMTEITLKDFEKINK